MARSFSLLPAPCRTSCLSHNADRCRPVCRRPPTCGGMHAGRVGRNPGVRRSIWAAGTVRGASTRNLFCAPTRPSWYLPDRVGPAKATVDIRAFVEGGRLATAEALMFRARDGAIGGDIGFAVTECPCTIAGICAADEWNVCAIRGSLYLQTLPPAANIAARFREKEPSLARVHMA